jgi:dTDP-L-rhamnose 4-epimerase
MANILITGGAGFIGRHVARALLVRGDSVRVYDALIAQVHGSGTASDPHGAELMVGDISGGGGGCARRSIHPAR